jgi:DNA-directed RNA polymerase subunit M/transcription elongation factor TFIIS
MTCPSCHGLMGVAEKDGEVVRMCHECGCVEPASPSEVALFEEDHGVGWTKKWPDEEGEE